MLLTRLAEMQTHDPGPVKPEATSRDAWSDEALVEAIVLRGSRHHFSTLMARYKDKVYRIALSLLGPSRHAEAEDVAQEVFIRLYERLESFRGDSRFSTWLYRLAINTGIDHQRREKRHRAIGLDEAPEQTSPDSAIRSIEQSRQSAYVRKAVESLPDTQRMMVHLFYWLGFKIREIAEVMDCPEGTVKVYLQRARMQLAGLLGEFPHD